MGKNLEQYAEQLQTKDFMLDLAASLQRLDPQQQNQNVVTFTTAVVTFTTAAPVATVPQTRGPTAPTDDAQRRPTIHGGSARPAAQPLIIEVTDAPRRSAAEQPMPDLDVEVVFE